MSSKLFTGLRRELRLIRYGALTLVAALSPATYDRATRQATAQALCSSTWQVLPGYALLSILLAAVLTRIVSITAASYGLSYLALEAVVSVFVVELIPLAAALFVAVRSGLEAVHRLAALRAGGLPLPDLRRLGRQVAPAVVANAFAVTALAVVSGLLALAVAYLVVYGPTPWGLSGYTRLVGQVFDPLTAPGLLLKILLFSLAVGIAPATIILDAPHRAAADGELRVMVRLLFFLVLIESASLALKRF